MSIHDTPQAPSPLPRPTVADLRRRLSTMNSLSPLRCKYFPIGLKAIDRHLPWQGLPCGALHEVTGAPPAVTGFLGIYAGSDRSLRSMIWITPHRMLYTPGLSQLGLAHDRVTFVTTTRSQDRSWAFEEALRGLPDAIVIGEIERPSLTETRRLHLAAEKSGSIGFLLRRDLQPSAALTRWRIESAPSENGRPRLRIMLERCRGGQAAAWLTEWDYATISFNMVALLADGSLAATQ